jgi:hypothetical protein
MSYYGSAIATLAAYGSMMFISYYLGNKYYPPYDMKKLEATVIISDFPQYPYGFRENYFVGLVF